MHHWQPSGDCRVRGTRRRWIRLDDEGEQELLGVVALELEAAGLIGDEGHRHVGAGLLDVVVVQVELLLGGRHDVERDRRAERNGLCARRAAVGVDLDDDASAAAETSTAVGGVAAIVVVVAARGERRRPAARRAVAASEAARRSR